MVRNSARKPVHPLATATAALYEHLEQIGASEARNYYHRKEWDLLGRPQFCDDMGSPDAAINFFLTALELWLSQHAESS